MEITKISLSSGKAHTLDIPITEEQYTKFLSSTDLIQNEFPNLSADEREFLISGITKEEWDDIFNDEHIVSWDD